AVELVSERERETLGWLRREPRCVIYEDLRVTFLWCIVCLSVRERCYGQTALGLEDPDIHHALGNDPLWQHQPVRASLTPPAPPNTHTHTYTHARTSTHTRHPSVIHSLTHTHTHT